MIQLLRLAHGAIVCGLWGLIEHPELACGAGNCRFLLEQPRGLEDDIMATTSSMFMYSLTIQPPSAITQAILGQFAGTKEQQIVTASGSRITIHRPDPTQGKISTILSQDVFGIVRTLAAFRLAGSNKGMYPIPRLPRLFSDSLKHGQAP